MTALWFGIMMMAADKRWDFYSLFYNLLLKTMEKERSVVYANLALEPKRPLNIYVAGCGTGLDFPYLPAGSRIRGTDFSPKMLQKAACVAERLRLSAGVQTELRRGYAERSGLPDGSQDLVLLHLILAVTDAPRALLEEAVRVLKPGGIISVWDKFLPDGERPSLLRRGLNVAAKKIATSVNLQMAPLLADLPLCVVHREFRMAKLMQHIVLRKQQMIKTAEDL